MEYGFPNRNLYSLIEIAKAQGKTSEAIVRSHLLLGYLSKRDATAEKMSRWVLKWLTQTKSVNQKKIN